MDPGFVLFCISLYTQRNAQQNCPQAHPHKFLSPVLCMGKGTQNTVKAFSSFRAGAGVCKGAVGCVGDTVAGGGWRCMRVVDGRGRGLRRGGKVARSSILALWVVRY